MKTIKKLSGLIDVTSGAGDKFLMKCPETGIVHVMRKRRSSHTRHYYMSTQGYHRGGMVLLRAFTPVGLKHHLTHADLQTEDTKYLLSYGG